MKLPDIPPATTLDMATIQQKAKALMMQADSIFIKRMGEGVKSVGRNLHQ